MRALIQQKHAGTHKRCYNWRAQQHKDGRWKMFLLIWGLSCAFPHKQQWRYLVYRQTALCCTRYICVLVVYMCNILCFSGEQTSPKPVRALNYYAFLCCPQYMTNFSFDKQIIPLFDLSNNLLRRVLQICKFANLLHVPVDYFLPADAEHRPPPPAKSTALAVRSCLLEIS